MNPLVNVFSSISLALKKIQLKKVLRENRENRVDNCI